MQIYCCLGNQLVCVLRVPIHSGIEVAGELSTHGTKALRYNEECSNSNIIIKKEILFFLSSFKRIITLFLHVSTKFIF